MRIVFVAIGCPAFSDYFKRATFIYGDIAAEMAKPHPFREGDKSEFDPQKNLPEKRESLEAECLETVNLLTK